jgi:hypothetical protein
MAQWLTGEHIGGLLPPDIVGREDLGYLIGEAEREVIQHYTRRRESIRFRVSAIVADLDDGVEHLQNPQRDAVVFLRYYKKDPANINTGDPQRKKFVDAMRREIAGVVKHMVETEEQTRGVTSKSKGAKSVSYDGGDVDTFPPGFGKYLKPFDLRPRNTHV